MAGVSDWKYRSFNFKVFADRKDFIESGKQALEYNDKYIEMPDKGTSSRPIKQTYSDKQKEDGDDFYGMIKELEYQKPAELKMGMDFLNEISSQIDMGGSFKKARIKITDDKRGVFDFGLASKGLYNPKEYFSQKLADELPTEFAAEEYGFKLSGIVPSDFIKEEYVLDKKQFWYTSFTNGEKYILTPQIEGERAIQLNIPDAKKIYKTSIKKSYLMFEKKGGKAKMVELYLPLHQSILLKHAIPLFLVAKFLQSYGVATRISTVRLYGENLDSKFFMWGYPIKDYGDEMDFNSMALNSVDTRWWYTVRTVIRSMNDKKNIINKIGENNKGPLSRKYDGAGGSPGTRASYVEVFSRYRNWYMEQIEKGELQPLRVDKKLMLIGGNFNSPGSLQASKPQIELEFFRILDTIDFQFNKPELVCARIYKRLVSDELDKYYIELKKDNSLSENEIEKSIKDRRITLASKFKTYVIELLIDTYTYPEGGEYAEPKESAEKLDEELAKKIEVLTQYLQSI